MKWLTDLLTVNRIMLVSIIAMLPHSLPFRRGLGPIL